MDIAEAQALLQIARDASEADRRSAFETQRRLLEEKIASAPTPGLADTYRKALARVVEAFEALELAAAAEASPALRAVAPAAAPPAAAASPGPTGSPPTIPPSAPPSGGGRPRAGVGFAVAAVLLVGGGGLGLWRWQVAQHQERLAQLGRRLDVVDQRLAAYALVVPDSAPAAAAAGADPAHEAWRRQCAQLRAAALESAKKRLAEHPSRSAALAARAELAADRDATAAAKVDEAERSLPKEAIDEAAFRTDYATPLLAWCFERAAAGDDRPARWARDEEPRAVAAVVAAMRTRLAALDLAEPPPKELVDELGRFGALVAADDADLKRWRGKLGDIDRLRGFLAAAKLPLPEKISASRRQALGGGVERLRSLVGANDPDVKRWREALPGETDGEAKLRAALGKLAEPDATATSEDAAAVEDLTLLAGAADPAVTKAAAALPEALYRGALRQTDQWKQRAALVVAAKHGHWPSLARLVDLQGWGDIGYGLEPTAFDPAHAPALAGEATAKQLVGELIANWSCRHRDVVGAKLESEMVRARTLLTADELRDPVVMHEAAWLWGDYQPSDEKQAESLRRRSLALLRERLEKGVSADLLIRRSWVELTVEASRRLQELADEAAFLERLADVDSAADLKPLLYARAAACLSDGDNPTRSPTRAETLYEEAASLHAKRGEVRERAACLEEQAGCATDGDNEDPSPARGARLYKAASAAYLAAADLTDGDRANAADCLSYAAALERPDRDAEAGSWKDAVSDYAAAAKLFGELGAQKDDVAPLAKSWRGKQASCLLELGICRFNDPSASWGEREEAFAEAGRAADAAQSEAMQAKVLSWQGTCQNPNRNPAGSWARAIKAYDASIVLLRKHKVTGYLRETLSERGAAACPENNHDGSWSEAADWYAQAAAAAEEAKAPADLGSALSWQAWCVRPDKDPQRGSWSRAAALYAREAKAYQDAEDQERMALALHEQAYCSQPDHDKESSWEASVALYERSAEVRQALGLSSAAAQTLLNEAYCVRPDNNPKGGWARAAELYRAAAAQAADANEPSKQGTALSWQADCLEPRHGEGSSWTQSAQLYGEAAACFEKADDGASTAHNLVNQARCLDPESNPQGSWDEAERLYERAAALRIREGNAKEAAWALMNQGDCMRPEHSSAFSWAAAQPIFHAAAAQAVTAGDKECEGLAAYWEAISIAKQNNEQLTDESRNLFRHAESLTRETGRTPIADSCRRWLEH